jgi:cyclophilin family peptidyl-prolyl cis-trans isomerase
MILRSHPTLLVLAAGLCLALAAGCGEKSEETTTPSSPSTPSVVNVTVNSPAATSTPGNTPTATNIPAGNAAAATNAPATNAPAGEPKTAPPAKVGKNPIVALEIEQGGKPLGTIKIQLDSDKAPISTKNFIEYVQNGHYNGTVFHRVISDFMIQGGGFTPDKEEKKTREPIKNEGGNGLKNKRGTVAMARTSDPDSATAQFFINVKDNAFLDRENARDGAGYAVFGKVISGMDVVDKIKETPKSDQGGAFTDAPTEQVVIKSAKVVKS